MLVYVVVLFAISTVEIGCNVKLNELMFIDNRAFPGGPVAWYAANFNVPVSTAANAAYITGNFLADALLVGVYGLVVNLYVDDPLALEDVYAVGLVPRHFLSFHCIPWVYR